MQNLPKLVFKLTFVLSLTYLLTTWFNKIQKCHISIKLSNPLTVFANYFYSILVNVCRIAKVKRACPSELIYGN